MTPLETDVRREILSRLKMGFESDEDIMTAVADILADEHLPEELEAEVKRLFPELAAQAKREERSWPEVTDCDRLDRVFQRLEAEGIVARHNFTCCQGCGFAEIGDEVDKAGVDRPVAGFTFYHWQDTEFAAEGHGICLSYGSVSGEEPESLRVGRSVAAALMEEGLKVDWPGTLDKRITVAMDWKRRRPK